MKTFQKPLTPAQERFYLQQYQEGNEEAKKILIVASGADKAEIVRDAFFGPITPKVPASVLQLHNDVTLVADEAALSKLPL